MPVNHRAGGGDRSVAVGGFVGRGPELDRISALLLGSARLVALVGPGGIGKTRLADETIRRYRKAAQTPVYWARLARLDKGSGAAAVEAEVARSGIGVDFADRTVPGVVADRSTAANRRPAPSILVMDNCEHVLDAAGAVIVELLERIPALTILATSREPIGWADEYVVAVPPLSHRQAVGLFCQRAELIGHPIADTQVTLVGQICRHIDNHPLYIRLAAARLLRQPLSEVWRELSGEARLGWNRGSPVGTDPRHQGVSDVIAWSYDLCDRKERLLFDRLAVFAAGYDVNPEDATAGLEIGAELEAIQTICAGVDNAGGLTLGTSEIEELLERLVDRSMVTMHMTPTAVRYSLLETLRLFAYQQLRQRSTPEVDEPERLAGRHREYYRDKVHYIRANWFGADEQQRLLHWVRAAWDNIQTAIETGLATPGHAATGLSIVTELFAMQVSFYRSSLREMRQWMERGLEGACTDGSLPVELHTAALALISYISLLQGRHEESEQILDECVRVYGLEHRVDPDWRRRPMSDSGIPYSIECVWGMELLFIHKDPAGLAILARAREKSRAAGDRRGAEQVEMFEAFAEAFAGTGEEALTAGRRRLQYALEFGGEWTRSWVKFVWSLTLMKHGDPNEAIAAARASLAYQLSVDNKYGALWATYVVAWSGARILDDAFAEEARRELVGRATHLTHLLGGSEVLMRRLGLDFTSGLVGAEIATATDSARRVLGDDQFDIAYKTGTLLRVEFGEVQQLALGTLSVEKLPLTHPARNGPAPRWDDLTAAEQDVAVLAAAGWANSAIGVRRGTSRRTVDTQVASIFQKLGLNAREDIIRTAPGDLISRIEDEAAQRPCRDAGPF